MVKTILSRAPNAPWELITEQDMLEREQKYAQRLQDLATCCAFVKIAKEEFGQTEAERAEQEHWDHYLRCDGLPRVHKAPEMRKFLAQVRHFQQIDADYSVDWTLPVDERSILTQNIFRKDKTRNTMRQIWRKNIGEMFENDVDMCLLTLRNIDVMLDNQAEMERVSEAMQMEIMLTRGEIEQEIDHIFDRLTYRVIRMDGVHMNSVDAKVDTWSYVGKAFAMDIWGLRNVPIRFEEMDEPIMLAELSSSGVRVQMPFRVLQDCMTLRCIHTNFDNYTQNAKSFERVIIKSFSNLNAGIVNIEDCLINEWYMQLELQEDVMEKMLWEREQFEETMKMIAEKTQKLAKEERTNDKNTKTKKTVKPAKRPKEPPLLPPGMLPDVYPLFLEKEQSQYINYIDEIYHPKHLKLSLDEINLRQHIMLGGIYSIKFVRRPLHRHYEKFNIVLHEDGRILHTMPEVVENSPNGNLSSILGEEKLSQSRSRLHLYDEVKFTSFKLGEDEMPYFFVTLKLPPELCFWSEPTPCHFMTSLDYSKLERSISPEQSIILQRNTIQHLSRHEGHQSAFSLIQRRDSNPFNIFRPSLLSTLRHSRLGINSDIIFPLANFSLDKPLNTLEVDKMARYCVPRIISSFKFPMEIKEEILEMAEQAPKAKKVLLRSRNLPAEETTSLPDIDFDFEPQTGPERVYPVFENVEPVVYPKKSTSLGADDTNTMYGLLKNIDMIRMKYNTKHRDLTTQAEIEPKKPTRKKNDEKVVEKVPPTKNNGIKNRHSKVKLTKTISNTGSECTDFSVKHMTVADSASVQFQPSMDADGVSERSEQSQTESVVEEEKKPVKKVIHWTTKYILDSKFDREAHTITIKTDRLGVFGLAFKRYEHFPFREWSMQPNEDNPEEIHLIVDTFHVRVVLYITAKGVRGYVTDLSQAFTTKPVKYLEILEPISDFRKLRKCFYEKNINIFAEHDAGFYIENGNFSIKHVAVEEHTYDVMALHCKLMKFYCSGWNRLATRRNLIMCMKNAKDTTDFSEVTVRITPEKTTFVDITELCSDSLDVINLDYKLTWRNVGNYSDLHQAINSMNPHATEVRNKDSLLLYQVKKMLGEIHLLSFS